MQSVFRSGSYPEGTRERRKLEFSCSSGNWHHSAYQTKSSSDTLGHFQNSSWMFYFVKTQVSNAQWVRIPSGWQKKAAKDMSGTTTQQKTFKISDSYFNKFCQLCSVGFYFWETQVWLQNHSFFCRQ